MAENYHQVTYPVHHNLAFNYLQTKFSECNRILANFNLSSLGTQRNIKQQGDPNH